MSTLFSQDRKISLVGYLPSLFLINQVACLESLPNNAPREQIWNAHSLEARNSRREAGSSSQGVLFRGHSSKCLPQNHGNPRCLTPMPHFPRNNHYNYRGRISMKSVKTWGTSPWGEKTTWPKRATKSQRISQNWLVISQHWSMESMGLVYLPTNLPF